ncbi:hypothetical protein [Azorhizobium doebereinerae]|uniref:hypothetical protein n=1 Tax=Azorhizobium doebereinerae TaxID=281091 RepID=UPI00040082CE|nr:hypothetical protein [Azorhizobium doebereinerae]
MILQARVLLLLLLATVPAAAQPKPPPGGQAWPCVQPKTPKLSLGAVWSGPDLGAPNAWTQDLDAAELAQKLASRRTPMDQVDGLLDAFAAQAGAAAKTRLPLVFAGVFDVIDAERAKIVAGIERYALGQQKLANRLRDEGEKLTLAKDSPAAAETPQSKELQEHLAWDTRIFEERARSLTYVCEVPVLLEQRVFEIGRRIQARL